MLVAASPLHAVRAQHLPAQLLLMAELLLQSLNLLIDRAVVVFKKRSQRQTLLLRARG